MIHMLTHYHKDRYKWAFHAQKEFIHSFNILNIPENDPLFSEKMIDSDQKDLPFIT